MWMWTPPYKQVLRKHVDESIIFTAFAGNEISASDALNLILNVIVKISVIQTQYTEWHGLSNHNHTLANTLN